MNIEIKDLPKHITGTFYRDNNVVLCRRCKGFGYIIGEELSDYHKREYVTTRKTCNTCEGDGRMIETVEKLSFNSIQDKISQIPYISSKDSVDPHGHALRLLKLRLDMTDTNLERKYPELAAISYDKYDQLVEKCRLMELLKKE